MMKPGIAVILTLFATLSCQKENYAYNEIDPNSRKNLYKLFIIQEDDDYYYSDSHGNCFVLVTNEVKVDGKLFGDFNHVHKAVAFARKNGKKSVDQITTISLRKKNGDYEKTWGFLNPIDIESGAKTGGFAIYDVKISLDEAYFEYENDSKAGLKIIFTEADTGNGFRSMILNFVWKDGKWHFLYKERIDTSDDAKVNYCRDSTTYYGGSERLPNFISYSDILEYYGNCK